MKKTTYNIPINYTYDPSHKGAPYTLNGEKWFNHGDLCEILDKACKGLEARKDGNGRYNLCSDIEETRTSVKSSGATLVSAHIGECFEEVKATYFATTHSTNYDYVVLIDEEVVIYNMNPIEFGMFLDKFGRWASDRKVIRLLKDSSKTIAWLEGLC